MFYGWFYEIFDNFYVPTKNPILIFFSIFRNGFLF